MPNPQPWSYTSLSDFKNCPKQFYHKRVIKDVREEQSEQMLWGNKVHKAFEMYMGHGHPLLDMLEPHRPFLDLIKMYPGEGVTEMKVGLDKRAQPCGFFDPNVWWRGVLDYHKVYGNGAQIVDYKTGKRKPDWVQLYIFAIWLFAKYPQVTGIQLWLYWTQDQAYDQEVVKRTEIPLLWSKMLGDLRQMKQSFHDDLWPAKPSGLCNGWCPVKTCAHWKPRRD